MCYQLFMSHSRIAVLFIAIYNINFHSLKQCLTSVSLLSSFAILLSLSVPYLLNVNVTIYRVPHVRKRFSGQRISN